jgi:hypothetical protein
MDSKKVTEALGFLDMKQICYCLAHALMKHIEFGKGFFFLMDLQQYFKMVAEQMEMENISFDKKELDFTYDLGDMKIDIKQKQRAENT